MSETKTFDAKTTTDEVLAGVDLTGEVAIVTGASTGLGFETARALHAHGATVVLAARDAAKLEAAAERIGATGGAERVETLVLDLADLDSVRRSADEALARFPSVQLLINNAGVMACPLARTSAGLEWQFGVNHVGHFLFTCKLAPALRRGAPARVVNLSSAGHKYGKVDFEDPSYERRPYDKWVAYGQSKTANALFSVGLERRLASHGVHAYAVHPGVIVTELGRHLLPEDIARFSKGETSSGRSFAFKSVAAGAATSIFAATSASLEGRGGVYLEDCHVAELVDSPGSATGCMRYALDPDDADRLWSLSERIVGQTFDFA